MRKFYLVIVGLLIGFLSFTGTSYAANYTVKPGDTLYKIAVNNGTTVDTLTSLNNLNSTMIYPGQVLLIADSGQAPTDSTPPTVSTQQYTVQPGDTLYLISKAYGTTVDTLMSQNNLSSTVIYPGQVLLVSGSGQAPSDNTTPAPSTQQYTVQPGDTLYLISKAYGTTVDTLMSQNNLSSTVIYPGQVLLVSGSGQAPSDNTTPAPSTQQQYTVQPGDTLYLISKAYGTTVDALMSQNNLSSTVIYPGQVLLVSGNGQAPSDNTTPAPSTPPSRGNNYSSEDRYLLAQIISAEAAGEIFEGQVAVGAVILNRIKDSRFPNNLRDVIFEPWQFEPVQNGTIYLPPVSLAIRAAEAALDGWDPVDGAVYFCNPDTAQSTDFFRTLTYVCRIGNHVFYK